MSKLIPITIMIVEGIRNNQLFIETVQSKNTMEKSTTPQ